jgi:predicted acyl esterase
MGDDASVFRTTVRIPTTSGEDLEAWVYQPDGHGPHPAVVMAHGFAGVKAGGLEPFAERFCREGFTAVAFDYRHWGGSSGEPREVTSIQRQREDYRTAINWAAASPDIDAKRIFIWGTSFSGMHVVEIATTDVRLRGAIAQCPLVDGLAGTKIYLSHDCYVCSRSVRSISSVWWSDARRFTSPRAQRLANSPQSLARTPSWAYRSLLPPKVRTGTIVSPLARYSLSARTDRSGRQPTSVARS